MQPLLPHKGDKQLPWMGPHQSPTLSVESASLACIGPHRNDLAGCLGSNLGPRGWTLLLSHSLAYSWGWSLADRVAGPCPRAGFITTGIIAFIQAWNDTARRASSLPYEPQSQTWSPKETSFSLQGGSLAHLCGFFVCFSGIGTKSNTASCIKLCVHTCAGETEGG